MDAVPLGRGLGQPPSRMDAPRFYVGVDVASETLAVALTRGPRQPVGAPLAVANDPDGLVALADWLAEHGAGPESALVCLESTGVYGEALCYGLDGAGFRVVVEDAAKVRRAMPVAAAKTDALDAARIADYAARFLDELRPWTPAEAVVEQVRTLLTMREQLTRERNAKQNARRMLARKVVQTPLANRIAGDAVVYLKVRIAEIDREVQRLTSSHPTIGPAVALVTSVPGVGLLLASHLCVATGGFSRPLRPKQASAWLGICPLEHEWKQCPSASEEPGLRPVGDPEAVVPRLDPARLHRGLAVPRVLPPEEGGGEERSTRAQQRRQQAPARGGSGASGRSSVRGGPRERAPYDLAARALDIVIAIGVHHTISRRRGDPERQTFRIHYDPPVCRRGPP